MKKKKLHQPPVEMREAMALPEEQRAEKRNSWGKSREFLTEKQRRRAHLTPAPGRI